MTVNTGDSRTEGANEIISFPFEKWLTKVDSNASFSPASLKTIQRDCPSVTQQMSIENFQTSTYELKLKECCVWIRRRKLFPFLCLAATGVWRFLPILEHYVFRCSWNTRCCIDNNTCPLVSGHVTKMWFWNSL